MFNSIHKFTLLVGLTAGLISCGDDHNDTGTEFAPNMYNSVGYEPLTQLQAKTVPSDSITFSAALLKNPLAATPENIEAGKLQYERFCQHCHGEAGKGDGLVAKAYKGVPVYSSDALKDVNDGHIYHVITHGKGRMWPHGSQISSENRWKIVLYVHELQKQ